MNKLATDAKKVTRVLAGKTVKAVRRHRTTELLIVFTDALGFWSTTRPKAWN
ncbi:MAG: hypothetical protein HC872_06470 [Gammaproteobacteria bacterium]|nr:hypothetical protein [Gammaproteobacteria bacterium]